MKREGQTRDTDRDLIERQSEVTVASATVVSCRVVTCKQTQLSKLLGCLNTINTTTPHDTNLQPCSSSDACAA